MKFVVSLRKLWLNLALAFSLAGLTSGCSWAETPEDHPIYHTPLWDWQSLEPPLPTVTFPHRNGTITLPRVTGVSYSVRAVDPDKLETITFMLDRKTGQLERVNRTYSDTNMWVSLSCGTVCGHDHAGLGGHHSAYDLEDFLRFSFDHRMKNLPFNIFPDGSVREGPIDLSLEKRRLWLPCFRIKNDESRSRRTSCEQYYIIFEDDSFFSYFHCEPWILDEFENFPDIYNTKCTLFYKTEDNSITINAHLKGENLDSFPDFEKNESYMLEIDRVIREDMLNLLNYVEKGHI